MWDASELPHSTDIAGTHTSFRDRLKLIGKKILDGDLCDLSG